MTKYPFFLIACAICILTLAAHAQDKRVVDSLQLVLQNQSGGDRFPALYEMAFEYIKKDNERALALIRQAEEAALMSGDSLWIVKSRRVKGQLLYFLERSEEAKKNLDLALPISVRNGFKIEQLHIEEIYGKLNLFRGNYDEALKYFLKNLEVTEMLADSRATSSALHHIAIAYYKLKDYKKALGFYERSLSAHQRRPHERSGILANLGLCYAQLRQFQKARYYVEESSFLCADCGEKDRINIEYSFGVIALGEGNLQAAERHLVRSFKMARTAHDTRFQLDNIYLLTELYAKQNRISDGKDLLETAAGIVKNDPPFNLELIKIYSRFYQFYLKILDYKKASLYQSKYIALRDSIYNEELTNKLMKIEARFLERENIQKISSQEQVISLKEERIRYQKLLTAGTGLLTLISFVLLIFVFRNYRKNETLSALLDKKVMERTRELERNKDKLLTVVKQQEIVLRRASSVVTDKINTLRGLCITAHEEVSDPVALNYMQRVSRTSWELSRCMRSVFGENAFIVSRKSKNHG